MLHPKIAYKETKCNYCPDVIKAGEHRLDAVAKSKHGGIIRVHYHVRCVLQKWDDYFNDPANSIKPTNGGGRTVELDLKPEEKLERKRLLTGLSSLTSYYVPLIAASISKPVGQLAPIELKRIQTFHDRRTIFIDKLEDLGGIPDKFKNLQEFKVQVTSITAPQS